MKRLVCAMSLLAMVGVSVLAGAQDDKTATIKEVMQKLHKGANSPLAKLKKALASDSPDWEGIQKTTKDFASLGAVPGQERPAQGGEGGLQETGGCLLRQRQGAERCGQEGGQGGGTGRIQEGFHILRGLSQGPQA